ncbi:MAG TPA: glutamine--fructose-6-phosphate aminotransferase, partial [Spirochaetota bacterium]
MCGIIGYVGEKRAARIIINGLKRLEYRGYDSAGIALLSDDLVVLKKKGKISSLEEILDYTKLDDYHVGIGHTRWATHGEPSDINSHPHSSCDGNIAVVHNGIIENFSAIKARLEERGHSFTSQTDSEVIAHLIEYYYKDSLVDALIEALSVIEGTYGIAVVCRSEPGKIVAARKGSPLVLGIGDNETIIASDCSAIVEHTRQVIYVDDNEIVEVTQDGFSTFDVQKKIIEKKIHNIDWNIEGIEKGGFAHFMLKEIHEQVETIRNASRGRILKDTGTARLDGLNLKPSDLVGIERI